MFAPALQKRVNVAVGGNASSYNAAMAGALASTKKFKLGVAAMTAAVVAMGAKIASVSIGSASSFQFGMAKVKAISGATGKAFKSLQDKAERLGKATQFTMVQIAAGMENLARAGKTPVQIIAMMGGVSALAASQNIELAEAARIVTDTMNAMWIPVSKTNQTVNLLAAAATSASLDINTLYEGLIPIAPTAHTLQMTLGTLASAIGLLANTGLKGTKATTVLRTSISRLSDPTGKARKLLAQLGVTMFDANGQFVGMAQFLGQLHDAMAGLTPEMKLYYTSVIFSNRAQTNWLNLIELGGERLDAMVKKITGSNAAFSQQRTMLDNVHGAWILLTSSITAMWTALGTPVLNTIQKGLEWIKRLIDRLTDKIKAMQPYIEAVFTTMYDYIKKNRIAFGYLIKQILNIAKVVGIIAGVWAALKMLMSPVTWLTAAAFVLYAAWKINLYGIRDVTKEVLGNVLDWIKGIDWKGLLKNTGEALGGITDAIASTDWAAVGKTLSSVFKVLQDSINWIINHKAALIGVFTALVAIKVSSWFIGIGSLFGGLKTTIGGLITLMTGPVGFVVAVSAVGVALGLLVKTHHKEIDDFFYDLNTKLKDATNGFLSLPTSMDAAYRHAAEDQKKLEEAKQGSWGTNAAFTAGPPGKAQDDNTAATKDLTTSVDDLNKAIINATALPFIPQLNLPGMPPIHKAIGGLVPGAGTGDKVPAMLEPGEFVVPAWMMKIPGIAALIKAVWSGSKRMAAGGAVGVTPGTGGGVVTVAPDVWDKLNGVLSTMYDWLKPRAKDQAALDKMFETVNSLVTTGKGLDAGYREALAKAQALAKATGADVDAINDQADTIKKTIPKVKTFGDWFKTAFGDIKDAWAPLKSVLSKLPGLFGGIASSAVDLVQSFVDGTATIPSVISLVVNLIASFIQSQIEALEKQKAELEKALAFYVTTFQQAASVFSTALQGFGAVGTLLSATANAFADSLNMLNLHGVDLLSAGMSMLAKYVNSLIGAITGLIQKSDAYQAVQNQGSRAMKAVSNLFGQFLWPLAALMKKVMDWLGIQDKVNSETMTEIGVPSMWKRARAAYGVASPGEIYTGGGGGTSIPDWANAIVDGIATAIENMLKSFGIDSWNTLLESFRQGSITFWNYVTVKIPELIASLTSIWNTVSAAIGGDVVSTLVGWLERGVNWLINDAPGVVQRVVDFVSLVWDTLGAVWTWLQGLNWTQIWLDIQAKFKEFKDTLMNGLPDLGGIEDKIQAVSDSIDSLKTVMKFVIAISAGAIIGGIGGALAPLTLGLSIGGAALGALAGAGLGAVVAGMFDKGGIIPGPIGEPQLIIGHGGENVQTIAQQRAATPAIMNEVHVYIGDEEITDLVVSRVGDRSRLLTGNRYALAALNGRG